MTFSYINEEPQRTRMGFAPDTLQGKWFDTVFTPPYAVFERTLADWRDPSMRTQALTAALMDAEENFVPVYRELYTGWLKKNPLVTNEDLVIMGLPKRNTEGRQPAPVPFTWPLSLANTATPRRVRIDFGDSSFPHKRAKPAGVHGAEIRWTAIGASRVVGLKDLVHSAFDTRTPFVLDFEEEERGHMLYFALRWENNRGEKGPFSPIQKAVIP